ncbi:MAG: antibiotic biosynthesis monooxygenase [Pleurocapsa sp. MO_226.B13]|nr:antibiotic biosynthesis monooxygenase [Pleurocapsa sp. MO_226.B13]
MKESDLSDPPVTVVVSRRVKPGCEAAFEKFISGITAAAMTFEGHLGTNVFRPSNPEDREYKIIFKFDRASNLRIWEESECRRQWLARAESLRLEPARIRVITGLETWFTLPSPKRILPPPRYKMATITLLALFPLIQIANLTLTPWLALLPLPLLLRSLIVTAILVLLMTYVVMPRMTKLFSKWLYPKKRSRHRK